MRLQQTQPVVRPPAAEVRTLAAPAVSTATNDDDVVDAEDGLLKMASIGVFALSLLTVAIQLWSLFNSK